MWQRLCDLLENPGRLHILLVGDFMMDRYLYGDAERISPEAPVPVLRVVREEDALGGAGSVAADIAALGAVPHCVGVTGDDVGADRLVKLLDERGADTSGLVRIPGRQTTTKTRLVGLAQHRHRQQLIRVDDESTEPVGETVQTTLVGEIERQLAECNVLCIEDYDKGVITQTLAASAIAAARKRGIAVLVDPAKITDYSRYSGATIITPNRTETETVCGIRLRSLEAVGHCAKQILQACKSENVCVTLDADGAALIGAGGEFEHVPTSRREVYDVTGAGDEVLAAMAVGLASGGTFREAVELANIAGGLEVEKFGCVPITRNEMVGEILLEHNRSIGKIRTLEQLLPELSRRRASGESIAFTNGCFDLIHAGHVSTFAFCKQHTDVLVLGLNSDSSIRQLSKGHDRPIIREEDRAKVLAAMDAIDYVVIFDQDTPRELIEAIQPDVLIKGQDWEGKGVVGQDIVEARGGRVILAPLVQGLGTSQIIARIRGESET